MPESNASSLRTVHIGTRTLSSYRDWISHEMLADIEHLAEQLRGLRVLQLNSTPYGGGVSELLRSLVPLLNDLGLRVDWKVISGGQTFFEITKKIHNGLQGADLELTKDEKEIYIETAKNNAALIGSDYDIIVAHDPQPAGVLDFYGPSDTKWIWRCHIDTAKPNKDVWNFLKAFLVNYRAAVYTMPEFVPDDLPIAHIDLIPPAIDPLSPKNYHFDINMAREILSWLGVSRLPLVTQVSRFDYWKDPFGVIKAYRLAREEFGDIQLALVGSMVTDDPESWDLYDAIQAEVQRDPLIQVFTNFTGVGTTEVNAFQRLSDVVVQKSIREGFGLVVSETMWKQTPIVAGNSGGIPLQMAGGAGGYLINTVEECADCILKLLRNPTEAKQLAMKGYERVRDHFLVPRLLLNELDLLQSLVTDQQERVELEKDPVCGMVIGKGTEAFVLETDRHHNYFCSPGCRNQFLATLRQR